MVCCPSPSLDNTPSLLFAVDQKIARGEAEKLQGNDFWKKGDLKNAIRHYHQAKMCVGGLLNITPEQKKKIDTLLLSILLNMVLLIYSVFSGSKWHS